jgi:hypothetical protein
MYGGDPRADRHGPRRRQRGTPTWFRPGRARPLLAGVLAVGAASAFAGGYHGMTGAHGLRTDWLERGPFRDYFVPGLVLFTLVGGTCLVACVSVLADLRWARRLAQLAGVVMFAFIGVEMAIMGTAFQLQPLMAVVAASILALARLLPTKPGEGRS